MASDLSFRKQSSDPLLILYAYLSMLLIIFLVLRFFFGAALHSLTALLAEARYLTVNILLLDFILSDLNLRKCITALSSLDVISYKFVKMPVRIKEIFIHDLKVKSLEYICAISTACCQNLAAALN